MSFYNRLIKNPLIATISNHIDGYPTPINLSYLWGFGSLAGIALGVQIVTGVLLAMHYAPEIHLAFSSVEHIMRDVRGGVALRYIHANGASMFFIVVYIHMFRGLYYGSYFQPRANLWYSGIVIFLLMMATAFMGYVLPWGQMSFWGATVITNLFSAVPGLGDTIVQTLWGGFSVDNPTLNRFFSLHYFMPFVIAAVAFLHLILLHQPGSNNPLGITAIYDRVPFYPYFYVKDLFGFFMFIWVFSMFVIYAPNYMGHPDNYIEANPLVTPAHIVPEWYFLPFYAILRTISDKLGGVILMVLAIVILAVLPIVDTSLFRSNFFKPLTVIVFWFFFVNSFALGWIGQEIVESPFIEMSNFVTLFYFVYFLIILPFIGFLENLILINYFFKSPKFNSNNFGPKMLSGAVVSKCYHYVHDAISFYYYTWHESTFGIPKGTFVDSRQRDEKGIRRDVHVYIREISQGSSDLDKPEFRKAVNCGSPTPLSVHTNLGPRDTNPEVFHPDNGGQWGMGTPTPHACTINSVFEEVPGFIDFSIFFSWLYVFQFVFLGIFLLFIIIYFPKNSKATMVLNRLISIIMVYTLWDIKLATVIRFQENTYNILENININQENSLYSNLFIFYSVLIIFLFFFGIIDRFFIANSGDMEFTILICFIVVGSLLLFKVHNFLDIILSLEVITLASYVLVSFEKKNRFSTYAGVQYFVLGSLPSGMLVLGSAMLYENWGTLVIEDLDVLLSKIYILNFEDSIFDIYNSSTNILENTLFLSNDLNNLYLNKIDKDLFLNNEEFLYLKSKNNILTFGTIIGFCLILFNFLFKITSAPFHVWAPSIYGKAPIATVTFLSIFSKVVIFFLMFKILSTFAFGYNIILTLLLLFCGVISILFGMIGAFTEKLIKRFFVYSSMSHVGFMLVGFALANLEGVSATFHYLPVYILSSFIMWFILLTMGKENKFLTQFKWLINTDMMSTLIFSFLLFSMSGIPPLGGFFIKLDILLVLLESSRFYLNYILFIFSVASFFYYLRVIKIMFFDGDNIYYKKKERSNERLWIISTLFIILLFYTIIVQKPLLVIQKELLSTLY